MTSREILVGMEEAGFQVTTYTTMRVVGRHERAGTLLVATCRFQEQWVFRLTRGKETGVFHAGSMHNLIHILTCNYGSDAAREQIN